MNKSDILRDHLKAIGSKGGKSRSAAKLKACAENAKEGGRPGKIYIYGIVNLDNGRIEYVGQTDNPRNRFSTHTSRGGKFRNEEKAKFRSIQFPVGMVILCVTTETFANAAEKLFYEHYKAKGQCRMNGDQFRDYYARRPEFLEDEEIFLQFSVD